MAANSSQAQDDLSDVIPQQAQASGISPYLVMAAQQEKSSGKPPAIGGPIHQLGIAAQKMQAGTASRMMAPPQPAQQPITQAQVGAGASSGNAPAQGQMGPPAPSPTNGGMPPVAVVPPKNSYSRDENDTSEDNKQTSKQNIGAPMGLYERALREAQGYQDTPLNDGTGNYIPAAAPNPNSPFQQQQGALDKLQALVAARAAKGQPTRPMDLSGLMMAADFANKTKTFGDDYARQQASAEAARTDQDRQSQQQFQDQAGALKEQGDLYKQAQTGALGIMGGGSVGSVNNLLTTQKLLNGEGNPRGTNANQGKMTDAQFQTQAGKLVSQGQAKDSSLNDLARMISLGNPTADNLATLAAAKSMAGTSRINVQEIQKFNNPDQSLWGRVDQIMGRAANGQYTPEDRAQLMQMYQQLAQGRQAEGQANMALINNMNDNMRMNPQDHGTINTLFSGAMHPNVGNTSFNLRKGGAPNQTTPVTPAQNYDGSKPLPAGANAAMKQARLKFLTNKQGQ